MKICKNTLKVIIVAILAILFIPTNVLAEQKDIVSINIKNFKEPKIGGRVGDSIPKKEDIELKFADGSANSIITSLELGYATEEVVSGTVTEKLLSPDDKFANGLYVFVLDISVDENLGNFPYDKFYSYLGKITINEKKLKYMDIAEADKNGITITLLIDFRDTISIDELNFTIYPTSGMKAKDVSFLLSDYIIDGDFSKKTSNGWEKMNDDEVFETGKKYRFTGGGSSFKYKLKTDNLKVVQPPEVYETSVTYYEAYMNINGKKTLVYVSSIGDFDYGLDMISILDYVFEIKDQITISFDTNGHGKNPDDQTIKPGEKVVKPDDLKEEGLVFVGWYIDKELNHRFDFNNSLYEDTTLYAKLVSKDDLSEDDLKSNFCNYKENVYKSSSDKDIKKINDAKDNTLVTTKLFTIYGGIGLIPWLIILLLIIGYVVFIIYSNKKKKEDNEENKEKNKKLSQNKNKDSIKSDSKLKTIKQVMLGIVLIIIILLLIRGCGSSSLIKTKQTNIDYDNDGICDLNCDKNNDGIPESNIDYNYDCIVDDELPKLIIKTEDIILSVGETKNASALLNYDIKGNLEEICDNKNCSSEGNIKLTNENRQLIMSFGASKDKKRTFYTFTFDKDKAGKTEKYFLDGCTYIDNNKEICGKAEFNVAYKDDSSQEKKEEYSCPKGYTLKNDKCTKIIKDIKDATIIESCPNGYVEYNSKCAKVEVITKPAGVVDYTCSNGVLNDSKTKCLINYGKPKCENGVTPVESDLGNLVCKYTAPVNEDGTCKEGYSISSQFAAPQCVKQTNAKCEKGYYNQNFGRCEDSIDPTPVYSCSMMTDGGYKLEGTNCVKETKNTNELKNRNKSYNCSKYGKDYKLDGSKCIKEITETIKATKE